MFFAAGKRMRMVQQVRVDGRTGKHVSKLYAHAYSDLEHTVPVTISLCLFMLI